MQVRDYRNWVAHGKRDRVGRQIAQVGAAEAYTRLREFSEHLGIATETERAQAKSSDGDSE